MSFGKRAVVQPSVVAQVMDVPEGFPWADDTHAAACNLAYGHLSRILSSRVMVGGRVHAETYVAAAGVIAGFAAQKTLLSQVKPVIGENIHVMRSAEGRHYMMGDILNNMLADATVLGHEKIWPLAAGASVQAGLSVTDMPDLKKCFEHIAANIGGANEGLPSTTAQPHAPFLFIAQVTWPVAEACFTGGIAPERPDDVSNTPQRWWSCIAAWNAVHVLNEVKSLLDHRTALTIMIEAAIYGSRLFEDDVRKNPFG